MNGAAELVLARLEEMGIAFEQMTHQPVHTIGDCAPIEEALGAVVAKNYFLTTKNRKRFFLCLVRPDARFRTADISRQAGSSRLSFGAEEELAALLHTYPGAVSPLGLVFDGEDAVELLVDGALRQVERIAFHPCDNARTVAMSTEDFFGRFLPGVGHAPKWVEIHDFMK